MSKPHTSKPPYPAQFREQMIELVRAGHKSGDLAREFGCHATSVLNWMRQADASSGVARGEAGALSANERQELIELRSPAASSSEGARHPDKGYGLVCPQRRQDVTPSTR
ncbi:MAG: transposase [Acidithiobacillus ferrivorans]